MTQPPRGPSTGLRSLGRLLPFLAPYRRRLGAGLSLVIASSAIGSVVPQLLRRAIDALGAPDAVRRVAVVAVLMLATALVGGVVSFAKREILNGVSRLVEFDIRDALFVQLESLDAPFYGRWRTGELMARLTNDLSAVRMSAGPAIMYLVSTVSNTAFALAFMVRIDARLTGLALLPVLLLPVIMVRLGRAVHDRFEAVQDHFGTMTTRAQENLAGVRVVRAYRQEPAEEARFAALGNEYLHRNMRLARLHGVMDPSFGLLAGLGAAIVLGVGGSLVVRGAISVGAFVAFGIYLAMLTWPMIALGWVTNLFQRGAASMARLSELLDARPAVTSPSAPAPLPPLDGRTGRRIEFRGVGFHYPSGRQDRGSGGESEPVPESRWVLRNVSFDLPAGATLGIVGAVGSGKTALIELLPRFFDPQEGEILLDGVPLRSLALGTLRGEIGYVSQESLLFGDTIGANIAYGTDAESNHDDTIAWAAEVAQLDATIAELPARYDTILGERGINLSGGQKQRTSIARALARRPSVVLLDDALSAVDTHTEAKILHGLRDALAGRTTVIASHRISAIRDASWILVLDDGEVVEQGRHDELIARDGRYASLLRRQQLVDAIEGSEAVGSAPPW